MAVKVLSFIGFFMFFAYLVAVAKTDNTGDAISLFLIFAGMFAVIIKLVDNE